MPNAPVVAVRELRERVAYFLALALRARENGNIELADQLVSMALRSEDDAVRLENAAAPERE